MYSMAALSETPEEAFITVLAEQAGAKKAGLKKASVASRLQVGTLGACLWVRRVHQHHP